MAAGPPQAWCANCGECGNQTLITKNGMDPPGKWVNRNIISRSGTLAARAMAKGALLLSISLALINPPEGIGGAVAVGGIIMAIAVWDRRTDMIAGIELERLDGTAGRRQGRD